MLNLTDHGAPAQLGAWSRRCHGCRGRCDRPVCACPQILHDGQQAVESDGKAESLSVQHLGGVHPDDFAVEVEQRAAAVAGVYGGVGLDVQHTVVGTERRDKAHRHGHGVSDGVGPGKPERYNLLALVGLVGKRQCQQATRRRYPNQRDIGGGVVPDHMPRDLHAVVERHLDARIALDDMLVRHDEVLTSVDYEARP